MSALGQNRTSAAAYGMSALGQERTLRCSNTLSARANAFVLTPPPPPGSIVAGSRGRGSIRALVLCLGAASALLAGTTTGLAQNPPSLRSSLETIRALLVQQGTLYWTTTMHNSTTNQTWSAQLSAEATKVVVDEPNCRVNFHWRTTVNGKVNADLDSGLPLRIEVEISLVSMAEDQNRLLVKAGRGNESASVQPQIWVVLLKRTDGSVNTVNFRDRPTAEAASAAMRQAMKLCPH